MLKLLGRKLLCSGNPEQEGKKQTASNLSHNYIIIVLLCVISVPHEQVGLQGVVNVFFPCVVMCQVFTRAEIVGWFMFAYM